MTCQIILAIAFLWFLLDADFSLKKVKYNSLEDYVKRTKIRYSVETVVTAGMIAMCLYSLTIVKDTFESNEYALKIMVVLTLIMMLGMLVWFLKYISLLVDAQKIKQNNFKSEELKTVYKENNIDKIIKDYDWHLFGERPDLKAGHTYKILTVNYTIGKYIVSIEECERITNEDVDEALEKYGVLTKEEKDAIDNQFKNYKEPVEVINLDK